MCYTRNIEMYKQNSMVPISRYTKIKKLPYKFLDKFYLYKNMKIATFKFNLYINLKCMLI